MSSARCPVCGGYLLDKQAEVEVKHGNNRKTIWVPAQVCQKCGERIYSKDAQVMMMLAEQELV